MAPRRPPTLLLIAVVSLNGCCFALLRGKRGTLLATEAFFRPGAHAPALPQSSIDQRPYLESPYGSTIPPRAVTAVMRLNLMDATIQRKGCDIFAQQIYSNMTSTQIQEKQSLIVQSGAHTLAIDAMKKFPDDWQLQASCTGMLMALAAWNKDTSAEEAKRGAIDATIKAISRHRDQPIMRNQIAGLVYFNGFGDENMAKMLQLGIVKLADEVCQANLDDAIIELSKQSLFSSFCENPFAKELILKSDYIMKSVAAIKRFLNNDTVGVIGEILEAFNTCFMNDLDDVKLYQRMVKGGIIDELIEIMRSVNETDDMDVLGQRLHYNVLDISAKLLESNPDLRFRFLKAGVLQAMASILSMPDLSQATSQEKDVSKYDKLVAACKSLSQLVVGYPSDAHKLVKESHVLDAVAMQLEPRANNDPAQQACRPTLELAGPCGLLTSC